MLTLSDAQQLPCMGEFDVLVCGGGPAGIGAALRAAREGVSVLVVEMGGCLRTRSLPTTYTMVENLHRKEGIPMKIVVLRSPTLVAPILRKVFKIPKEKRK